MFLLGILGWVLFVVLLLFLIGKVRHDVNEKLSLAAYALALALHDPFRDSILPKLEKRTKQMPDDAEPVSIVFRLMEEATGIATATYKSRRIDERIPDNFSIILDYVLKIRGSKAVISPERE